MFLKLLLNSRLLLGFLKDCRALYSLQYYLHITRVDKLRKKQGSSRVNARATDPTTFLTLSSTYSDGHHTTHQSRSSVLLLFAFCLFLIHPGPHHPPTFNPRHLRSIRFRQNHNRHRPPCTFLPTRNACPLRRLLSPRIVTPFPSRSSGLGLRCLPRLDRSDSMFEKLEGDREDSGR